MSLHPELLRTLLREMLEKQRRTLQAALDADRQDARRGALQAAGEVADRKDLAEAYADEALAEAEGLRAHDALAAIDAALRRLDAPDHGRCSDCGAAIGQARLLAVPTAQRCAACQSQRERRPAVARG